MNQTNRELIAKNVVRFKEEIDLINKSIENLNNMRGYLIRGEINQETFEKFTFEFNSALINFNALGDKLYAPIVANSKSQTIVPN